MAQGMESEREQINLDSVAGKASWLYVDWKLNDYLSKSKRLHALTTGVRIAEQADMAISSDLDAWTCGKAPVITPPNELNGVGETW